jgi:hypothetical protein
MATRPTTTGKRKRSKPRRANIESLAFAEADQRDREYWWSRTPAERMRELERLRQLNYGYGQGKPLPRFQRILRVAQMGAE